MIVSLRRSPHLAVPAKAGTQRFCFFVIPRKPLNLVIPAKAGIQLLAFAFVFALIFGVSRNPPHVRVRFRAHPCARVTFSCLPKRK